MPIFFQRPTSSQPSSPDRRVLAVLDLLEAQGAQGTQEGRSGQAGQTGHEILAACAKRHGVNTDELATWRSMYLHGARASLEPRLRPQRRKWLVASACASVLIGTVVTSRSAFSRPEPGQDLTIFRAGEPARAAEVNANFALLRQWMEQKLGSTASGAVELAQPLYAHDEVVSQGGFGITLNAAPAEGVDVQPWHFAKVWTEVVMAGRKCTEACGKAVCLVSYRDEAAAAPVECSDSTRARMCVCAGRSQ